MPVQHGRRLRQLRMAAEASQLWIVTHSERLAQEVETRCGVRAKRVVRNDGATWIDGMRLTGAMEDDDE